MYPISTHGNSIELIQTQLNLRVSDSKNGAQLTLGVTILYSDLYQLMQNDQKLWKMIIFFI